MHILGIQLFYIIAMILSNYCIYPVDVKTTVLHAYCKYTKKNLGQGSKVEKFVTDWLYHV